MIVYVMILTKQHLSIIYVKMLTFIAVLTFVVSISALILYHLDQNGVPTALSKDPITHSDVGIELAYISLGVVFLIFLFSLVFDKLEMISWHIYVNSGGHDTLLKIVYRVLAKLVRMFAIFSFVVILIFAFWYSYNYEYDQIVSYFHRFNEQFSSFVDCIDPLVQRGKVVVMKIYNMTLRFKKK